MISHFPANYIFQWYKEQAKQVWGLSKKFLSLWEQRAGGGSFPSLARVNHSKWDNQATCKDKLEVSDLCISGQRQ